MERRRGFTLIEVLIVLGLGMILITLLNRVYFQTQETHNRQQERMALQKKRLNLQALFRQEFSEAGYLGCRKLTENFLRENFVVLDALGFKSGIKGYEPLTKQNWAPNLKGFLRNRVNTLNDVIEVFKIHPLGYGKQSTNPHQLEISAARWLTLQDIALISDCEHVEILKINHISGRDKMRQILTLSKPLNFPYSESSQISVFQKRSFYIRDTGRKNKGNRPIYSLFLLDEQGQENELLDNIESMQIEYGVRQEGGSGVRYFSAKDIKDWLKVILVKFSLSLTREFFNKKPVVGLKPPVKHEILVHMKNA